MRCPGCNSADSFSLIRTHVINNDEDVFMCAECPQVMLRRGLLPPEPIEALNRSQRALDTRRGVIRTNEQNGLLNLLGVHVEQHQAMFRRNVI